MGLNDEAEKIKYAWQLVLNGPAGEEDDEAFLAAYEFLQQKGELPDGG